MLNDKVRLHGVAGISKNRKISYAAIITEICGGIPPYAKPFCKGIQNLQNIFSIQSKSTFLSHR